MAEFMISMERNAHLRKLVEADLRITEETLREEFARRYGARVQVRHIQIPQRDNHGLSEALELLARGSDFADVARQLSKNPTTAARGGEMEPFTFDDPNNPAALREAAFALKEGGVSNPVLAGQFFHILKAERRIPADRARFEDKRDEVEKSLRERAIPQAMGKLAVDLFQEAKITVLDSKLRGKYQEFLDRGA
jgi:parvulin-like peptidyl-prolyl isomerase